MTAALAEVAVGLACDARLGRGHGLDDDAGCVEQLVDEPAGDRVAAAVDDSPDLDVRRRRDPPLRRRLDRLREAVRFRLVAQDRDECRRVDDQRGIPSSAYNRSP